MPTENSAVQAKIFTHYLIHKSATPAVLRLYQQALDNSPLAVSSQDQRALALVMRQPRLLGIIDAGLALARPHSELRRRLYILLAILEASPDYWQAFLPVQRSPLYIIFVGFSSIRAVIRATCGLIIVKVAT